MLEPEKNARAELVSLSKLPKLVDEAIAGAHERLGRNDLIDGPLIKKWEIVGKRAPDLQVGQRFADEVTQSAARLGLRAEPALLQIGKLIICGFIEPPNIPLERQF